MKRNIEKIAEIIGMVSLILFGLLIVYQVIKKIFGGSWTTENIVISLLVFNLGCVFTIGLSLVRLGSDHNHLKNQFRNLASDFKKYAKK